MLITINVRPPSAQLSIGPTAHAKAMSPLPAQLGSQSTAQEAARPAARSVLSSAPLHVLITILTIPAITALPVGLPMAPIVWPALTPFALSAPSVQARLTREMGSHV
jgi:hypothetical protein